MARKKKGTMPLQGAEEFAGPDTEKEAIEKIAQAKAAAEKEAQQDKKRGDNGGPIMDPAAWQRAVNEYTAEMLEIADLQEKIAECRGRISSIKKVARSCGVDWENVKRHQKDHKRIAKGELGEMVAEERRYRQLLKITNSPLGTQFTLWDTEPEAGTPAAKPAMDPELQGQHAYRNKEERENNPFQPGTEAYADWDRGWNNAMAATAKSMAPNGGAEAH